MKDLYNVKYENLVQVINKICELVAEERELKSCEVKYDLCCKHLNAIKELTEKYAKY